MKKENLSVKIRWGIVVITFIGIFGCRNNEYKSAPGESPQTERDTSLPNPMIDTMSMPMVKYAQAIISATYPDTAVSGTIRFDADSANKVIMMIDISVPSKAGKTVAIHIHEHGNCGDKANAAHEHWNPTNEVHGKWGSESFHAGDVGNVELDAKGKGNFSMATDRWTLGGNASKNILGKAVIVHGGMDDYNTQPSGNSGARIGCGIIQ